MRIDGYLSSFLLDIVGRVSSGERGRRWPCRRGRPDGEGEGGGLARSTRMGGGSGMIRGGMPRLPFAGVDRVVRIVRVVRVVRVVVVG